MQQVITKIFLKYFLILFKAKDEGVQLVEFDVSLTKDGVAVLLHDETLDRTTDLSGNIGEIYYNDLKNCNCASKFVFEKSE